MHLGSFLKVKKGGYFFGLTGGKTAVLVFLGCGFEC